MDPLAALLSEWPPQQLSATELHSRIALLEDATRACSAELESRTMGLDAVPDENQQLPSPRPHGVGERRWPRRGWLPR